MRSLSQEDLDKLKQNLLRSNPIYGYEEPTQQYQEPERDEQGVLYGYKVLVYKADGLYSPLRPAYWENGELAADAMPRENNTHGIYCTKRMNSPELEGIHLRNILFGTDDVLVKVALFGVVIEGETGFRAEHAQIVGVYQYGHWKSYQDSQGRSEGYSNCSSEARYREAQYYSEWKPRKDWSP